MSDVPVREEGAGTLPRGGPRHARRAADPQRRREVAGHEQDTGRGREPGQGEDDREVPRRRLRRPGFVRPHPGPPQERPGRGRRPRVRGHLPGPGGLEEARRGPEEGPEGERGPDPRDGLRPRGRGDRVPRRVPARGGPGAGQAGDVHRDHARRDPGGLPESARDRPEAVRRAGGAARARPAGRLQDLAAAVAAGPAGALGRARAVGRAPHDRRARARDPRLHPDRVLERRRSPHAAGPGPPVPRPPGERARGPDRRRARQEGCAAVGRGRGRRARRPAPRGRLPRRQGGEQGAQGGASAPVQDLHPAAGGRPQAGVRGTQDDDPGAAPL